jgi:hypothetical protein
MSDQTLELIITWIDNGWYESATEAGYMQYAMEG